MLIVGSTAKQVLTLSVIAGASDAERLVID
jgi:hypothetical protein